MFTSPDDSLRAVLQFSPLAILELNPEGKIKLWNNAAERMFGWVEREVLGRVNPIIGPETRAEYQDDISRLLAGSTIRGKDVRLQHKDGRRLDVRLWASPIHNVQSEITGITAILEDITDPRKNERKLRASQAREQDVEAQLQRSEERMRLAFDAAKIGFWDWNIVTGEMLWSATASRLMGLPEDSPTSFAIFMNAVHPDDRKAMQESIESAVRDNKDLASEYRVLRPDGSLHWRFAKGRAIYDATGHPVRMVGIAIDIDDRKAADKRLLLQAAALEAAANSIVITDNKGTILWTNQAFSRLTGYSSEEVLGKNPRLLKSGEQDSAFYTNMWATITSGRTWQGELTNRRKDGSLYTEEMTITPLHIGTGGITHYVAIKQDVTSRKIAEEALRQAEEKYRRIFEDAMIGIFQVTPEGRPVSINRALARIHGYDSPEQLLAEVSNLGHQLSVDPDALQELGRVLEKDGLLHSAEFEIFSNDGSTKWVLANVRTVSDADGKVVLHEGTVEDITERRKGEEFLREKAAMQEQLSMVLATVPGVVYSFLMRADGSSAIPFASSRLRDIFDVAPDAIKLDASPALAMIHPDDLSHFQEATADSFRRLRPWHEEFRVNHPKRGLVWVKGDASPERQQDGSVLWHGFLIDTTERKHLESQLLQAQKMEAVGRLAGGVSHDFNNIMGIVLGYSDLIAETLSPSDLNLHRIMKIRDAALRATGLIRQLLAFSRLQVFAPTLMDLNVSITHLAEMLPRLLGEDIQLTLSLNPNLWTVKADPSQIDQVLLNLSVNARDAMPHGGKLVIETHNVELDESCSTMHPDVPPGPFAMICVSDTGTGISSEAMPHIFDPFFTTKEMGKGTGLGLSTVYGIVRQSGGFISVDTKVPGGTTFKIYLPRQCGMAPVAVPKRENARPKTVGSKRILLAEDDAALREIVSIQLEELGYTVLAASNGREALRMAEKQEGPIDLLLTDVVMPGMNGRQLADRLKQKIPALKVLFVSGYSGDVILREGSLEPGAYFVHKPITKMALDEKLRSIFRA
jgi:PAS domain S-box-containing protein